MSKSKPSWPPMFWPSRFCLAAALEARLQVRPQIGVFRPEVDDPVPGPDHPGPDRHPLEHQVGVVGEDDAVLEGAGLAFVGVADDVFAFGLRSSAARSHFRLVGKPAPPRPRRPERLISASTSAGGLAPGPRPGPLPGSTRENVSVAGPRAPCVMAGAPFRSAMACMPKVCRHCSRMPWTFSGVTRVKIAVVDQQGRPLVAHPQAVGPVERELAVGRGLAEADAQVVLQLPGDVLLAGHVAGDRAAQADHELPLRLLVQETVERDHAVDLHRMDVQQVGDHLHAVFGDAEVPPLHLLQDGHQRAALAAELVGQADQLLAEPLAFGDQHPVSPCESRGLPPEPSRTLLGPSKYRICGTPRHAKEQPAPSRASLPDRVGRLVGRTLRCGKMGTDASRDAVFARFSHMGPVPVPVSSQARSAAAL